MDNIRYLKVLSNKYPSALKVAEEIINLQAILNLPKGTELFLSDIHGEYDSFSHILRNGSGIIRKQIEDLFTGKIAAQDMRLLATLIYYPNEKLALLRKEEKDTKEFYTITLYRLVQLARVASSRYTRKKVQSAIGEGFVYIIDELINIPEDSSNFWDKKTYYSQIIESIVELNQADKFIVAISDLIKQLAIDHLHVIGDIFDRGPYPKKVLDTLMQFHSIDIQWGNHDMLWMGAHCGSDALIANAIRICARYDNIDTLEDDYYINTRLLSTFALETYKDEDCKGFLPIATDPDRYLDTDRKSLARIHKAIAVIQFKLEGQLIKRHPEYKMDGSLLLDKINFAEGTITIKNKDYQMSDTNFPTIDPKDPYKLTDEERNIMHKLRESFMNSRALKKHVDFLFAKGSTYKCHNSNLLFHGCIPMEESGEFSVVDILGKGLKGKAYLDAVDKMARKGHMKKNETGNLDALDFMWYMWCGPKSPLFGKDKAATFERYFIKDKAVHKEVKDPYYKNIIREETCNKVFGEFGLSPESSHIINGHTPVKEKDGESPIKANGKLLVIDGGFSKAYRSTTGRAGYTLTCNSHGLVLSANEAFDSISEAIREETDIKYEVIVRDVEKDRKRIGDTDVGQVMKGEIEDLMLLIEAYRDGVIQEKM